jgi:hypothetical protein
MHDRHAGTTPQDRFLTELREPKTATDNPVNRADIQGIPMSISSTVIAWPAYLLLEGVLRYWGFIRSTGVSQRKGKFCFFYLLIEVIVRYWRFIRSTEVSQYKEKFYYFLFIVISPGWAITDGFKSKLVDTDTKSGKEARKDFILSNNTDNIKISALLLLLSIVIQELGWIVPSIFVGFLFWRFMSRSFEISRAFVDDILNSENKSGLDRKMRIELALRSYAEIFIYSAAFYSVLSPSLASLKTATLGALYVGTLTNVAYVSDCIECKHIIFVQIFATLSLVILSIAGYLSNIKDENGKSQ